MDGWDEYWLRKSHLIIAFCSFEICHMLTDICALQRFLHVCFCGFPSNGSHICGCDYLESSMFHLKISFFTFEYCQIIFDILALGPFCPLCLCSLHSFCFHINRGDDHCLCKSHFIFVLCSFGIGCTLSDIWARDVSYQLVFGVLVAMVHVWVVAKITGYVSLVLSLRFAISKSFICSLTFELYNGPSMFIFLV